MTRWFSFPLSMPLPYGRNCVYVVIEEGQAVYVGQTSYNLAMRVIQHRAAGAGWAVRRAGTIKVSFSKKYGEHAMRELRLIAKLNPVGNKHHGAGSVKPWAISA